MMKITTCILLNSPNGNIDKCIQSVFDISDEIIIGTDLNINFDKYKNVKLIKLKGESYDCKNKLLKESKNNLVLFLEPWEILISGHKNIATLHSNESHYVQVLQSNIITKEVRILNKVNDYFSNSIDESVVNNKSRFVDIVLFSNKSNVKIPREKIEKFKSNRYISTEIYYHEAFLELANENYDKFVKCAEYYLFHEKKGMSSVMMKYYLSMIKLYIFNQTKDAFSHIVPCLYVNPLMAEFWCLLGDIFYKTKQYDKAEIFYENGIILGSRRLKSDRWPIELLKYEEYPKKMISSCKKIISETKTYTSTIGQ